MTSMATSKPALDGLSSSQPHGRHQPTRPTLPKPPARIIRLVQKVWAKARTWVACQLFQMLCMMRSAPLDCGRHMPHDHWRIWRTANELGLHD